MSPVSAESLSALDREAKRAAHVRLAESGMSTRDIAAVTGMGNKTVARDIQGTVSTDTVGHDGRVRPRRSPRAVESAPDPGETPRRGAIV